LPTLLLVPPDVRPPTLAFPKRLAEAVGWRVVVPPPTALPRLNEPGDTAALAGWLRAEAPAADLLIVSLETLALGGLIPARRVDTPAATALAALEVLPELRARSPRLRALAAGVVVRVAHDDDPIEEKPYYGVQGAALRAYSDAFDRHARHPDDPHARRLREAEAALPAPVLTDWLATRERNHRLHLAAMELLADGVLEHLAVTLDDTTAYGLAAHDRRRLEARADALGVWPRFDLYPGADEVPATLLARALAPGGRVALRLSAALGAAATTIYEDRPLGPLIDAHLRAAGSRRFEPGDTAGAAPDWVLAVNGPATAQAPAQPDHATVDTPARDLPGFVDAVARDLAAGRRVAVADVAYPNGAERRLLALLGERVPLADLAGFAAWNTAGNSLGSAIAMGALAPLAVDRAAWAELLFGRLVDDVLYQGVARERVRSALQERGALVDRGTLGDPDPYDLGDRHAEAEALVEAHVRPLAEDLWRRHFAGRGLALEWRPARLAWPRLFTGVFPLVVRQEAPA
jgi:hypothetical protein